MPFPYSHWNPLSVAAVEQLFHNAPFRWGLAGGYAVEQFLGTSIQAHGDIDCVAKIPFMNASQGGENDVQPHTAPNACMHSGLL